MLATPSPQTSARHWLHYSGIQTQSGGVARYYRSDLGQNARVSTEITGYAVSAFVYLYERDGDSSHLEAGTRAASFLTDSAWNPQLSAFPFEHSVDGDAPHALTYFFDTGIIIRGLLALWRVSGSPKLLQIASQAGDSLQADFVRNGEIQPILQLPTKTPIERSSQWSRNPGCYQLKSALAWHDLYEVTGEQRFLTWYETALEAALETHLAFLPAETEELTMDRLHAYSYFLEGLFPFARVSQVGQVLDEGIHLVSRYLLEIAPSFERSDVYAQLLRVRLLAHHLAGISLRHGEADEEADRLRTFHLKDQDSRIDGGYAFGRKRDLLLPYVNPVSTAFGLQALDMWNDYLAARPITRQNLI